MTTHAEPTTLRTVPARWPHRRFRPTTRAAWRVPGGLLGMLALVAAVELSVTRCGDRFVDAVANAWRFSARAAAGKAPGCDVLCLGDSLVKHGLSPKVLAEVTGRKTYNLAAPASPVPMTYFLLRRALDAGARPSAIVFDLKPSLQIGGPAYGVRCYAEVLKPGEALALARTERFNAFAAEFVVESLLPSYRGRREIRDDLMAAFRGETSPLRNVHAVCARNWTVNDGVNIATPRPGYTGQVTEPEHWHMMSRGFYPHKIHVDYTRRLLALAADRAIRAYLVLPPFVPDLAARRHQTGAEGKYAAYVRSLQDRFPALTVLDAREAGFPPSAFVDPIHLDERGTLALSAEVAAVLREDFDRVGAPPPPPKRWVRLPAYRERPIPADLEDVELSRARIGLPQVP